jgi:hypothetical protein
MALCDLPGKSKEVAIAFRYTLAAPVGVERLTPTLRPWEFAVTRVTAP